MIIYLRIYVCTYVCMYALLIANILIYVAYHSGKYRNIFTIVNKALLEFGNFSH